MDAINDLIIEAAGSPWLFVGMFAVAVIDGFFPPVPSETVLVAAASVAMATGNTNLVLLCLVAAAGAVIGDNIAYAIGRTVGTTRFAWMRRPRVASAFARAHRTLTRRGAPLILGARYIPVGRIAVNMSAGALGYPRRRFLVLTVLAGCTWAIYSACIGVLAGHWLQGHPLLSALLGIVLAITIGVVIDKVTSARRRRLEQREQPGQQRTEPAAERDSTRQGPTSDAARTGGRPGDGTPRRLAGTSPETIGR